MKFCVLGAGSAGLMTALAVKRAFPSCDLTLLHSSKIPVIGVGESTTVLFPPFLHHSLGVDMSEFFHAVDPGWKLGIRFEWGDPSDTHFNYTFDSSMSQKPPILRKTPAFYCMEDWSSASRTWQRMDACEPPKVQHSGGRLSVDCAFGYHVDNHRLIQLLTEHAQRTGVNFTDAELADVELHPTGDVAKLNLVGQSPIEADLFFDCSGFASHLLKGALGESFHSYDRWLFCDRAIVGRRERQDEPIRPYTTVETMDHGWCWRIDFPTHWTRGYVYSSQFCSDEEALNELSVKNPQLTGFSPPIPYPRGRCERFWVRNVVGIGNACGFVEPLEATALHLVIEQVRLVCRILDEADLQPIGARMKETANQRFRILWDEVRDFLTVHYRFNRRSDSDFWQYCRKNTELAGAEAFVKLYQEAGPSTLSGSLLEGGHIFGYDGFMAMLVGMRVPTQFKNRLSDQDRAAWNETRRHGGHGGGV